MPFDVGLILLYICQKRILMTPFDYISELKSPRLKMHEDGSLPSPPEVEAYLSAVEHMRQEYLSYASDKEDRVLRVYERELKDVEDVVNKRGFARMNDDNIVAAITGGIEGSETFLVLKNVDSALLASVKKTREFIKSLLGGEDVPTTPIEVVERDADKAAEKSIDTGWYNIDEVCQKYKLSKNNIKNRKWRINKGFPTHQDGAYSPVRFSAVEVEEWIAKH